MADTDVLVAGAGPTGLVLALWLARLGVRVRIVDKAAEPPLTSRALGVQARTLELYQQIGLGDVVADRGRRIQAVTMWVAGRRVAHAVLGDLGRGLSPYPYALVFPQDEHERLLTEWLADAGVAIEHETELIAFQDGPQGVTVQLKGPSGSTTACTAGYVAGCDGAHSAVRESLTIGFGGGTYQHLFYVADVEGSGPALDRDLHVALDRTNFLAVFPLKENGRARLVGTIREDAEQPGETLSWADVSHRVIQWMRIDVERVNWFSTYRVHHRVANRFRSGRAFLLGDAAHIHSPVGAQGMNTGIGDAVNLAWKLAAVVQGRADAAILDTYETERIAFARRLVATTDQAFTAITSTSALARTIRLRIVPLVLPLLFSFRTFRTLMFRTVSQTAIDYRGSWLSVGGTGRVRAGDRLPWVDQANGAEHADNFAPLTSLDWQVHVYGTPAAGLRAACERRSLALHVFPWTAKAAASHLRRDAAYLVRPDGYIGLVDEGGAAPVLDAYLDARNITSRAPLR